MASLLVLVLGGSALLVLAWHAVVWLRQLKFHAFMRRQGVRGPTPVWFVGNAIQVLKLRIGKSRPYSGGIRHDLVPLIIPDVTYYTSRYGKQYLSWWFTEPRITICDMESIKEVLVSKQCHLKFTKSKQLEEFVLDFIGRGILVTEGDEWFHRRKVLAPAFQTHKIKNMVSTFRECTEKLIERWNSCLKNGQTEMEIFSAMKTLAADIISHTAFGSSYVQGERVFKGLTILSDLLIKRFFFSWIPFFRYLPTPLNFRIRKTRKEIDEGLLNLIRERRSDEALSYGNDLLGTILDECVSSDGNKSLKLSDIERALVDECKTFYFAGHETSAAFISWSIFLLASNSVWQERARAEVKEHCSHGVEDAEVLAKLKVVSMILYESLRLYPPVVEIYRVATQDMCLNGLKIPRGTGLTVPILSLHHDKALWGEDADEFNPERFAEGAAKASNHPSAFMPFLLGPRICLGQTFALMEAKVIVAMLLNTFSFRVSPSYRHNPAVHLTIHPVHGMQLLLERISS